MNTSLIRSSGMGPFPAGDELSGLYGTAALSSADSLPPFQAISPDQRNREMKTGVSPDAEGVDIYAVLKLYVRAGQAQVGFLTELRQLESVFIEKAGTLSVESSRSRGMQNLIGAIVGGVGQIAGGVVQTGIGIKAGSMAHKAASLNQESIPERAPALAHPGEGPAGSLPAAASAPSASGSPSDPQMALTHRSQALSVVGNGVGSAIGSLSGAARGVFDFRANEHDAKRSFQDLRVQAHNNDLQANDVVMRQRQDEEREMLQTMRNMRQQEQETMRALARA
jgi:hypothetical protein